MGSASRVSMEVRVLSWRLQLHHRRHRELDRRESRTVGAWGWSEAMVVDAGREDQKLCCGYEIVGRDQDQEAI